MSKIICERVELRNFLSYGNNWTDIELLSGINAIIGHDEDKDRSNGSGKSSIISSIYFALFGKSLKDVSLDKIINWRNGKQCEVRFHFTKDGVKYMIHRGIKPGILSLTKDGVNQPLLSDKREFQKEIEQELIGMDHRSAQMINFQNANSLVSVFNAKKDEKRKFIEKFFNLEIYTKINEVVNKKLGVITNSLSEVVSDIELKKKRVLEIQHDLNNMIICNVDEEEKRLLLLNDEICSIIIEDVDIIKQQLKDQQLFTTELTTKRDEVKSNVDNTSKVVNSLNITLTHNRKRIEQIGDISEQRLTVNKINEVLPKLKDLDVTIDKANHGYKLLDKELYDVEYTITYTNTNIKRLQKELNSWDTKTTIDNVECPTCFQKVNPEHIKSHIEEKRSSLSNEMQFEQDKLKQLEVQKELVKSNLVLANTTLESLRDKSVKKAKLELKLATYTDLEQKELELTELNIEVERLEEELEANSQILGCYTSELNTIESKLKSCISEENRLKDVIRDIELEFIKLDKLKGERDNLMSFIDKQKEVIRKINMDSEVKTASIEQLNKEIKELEKGIEKKSMLKDYLTYIKETLKDDNTKQYAISNIVPYINSQTNYYLSETGHNYYVKFDNWLEGEIMGAGVGACDFDNMSGGEGRTIDFAVKMSFIDVARRQSGHYLDIMVLDELLDSSVDSVGLEGMMNIVRLKQQEDDLKVYIVSHRDEIAEYNFDRIYKVTKKNSFSNISLM